MNRREELCERGEKALRADGDRRHLERSVFGGIAR